MEKVEVIFYDEDEMTVLDRQLVDYGSSVVYNGKIPVKPPENHIEYKFVGWTDEDKLANVTSNLVLVAKYVASNSRESYEYALLKASLENARNSNLSETIEAGQRVIKQQKALEKDSRTSAEIVAEVMSKGKTEIGIDREDFDR